MSELCGIAVSPRDEQLKEEGWVKQFSCGEPRLTESKELFESMGKEVHLEQMTKEDQPLGSECDACFIACDDTLKTIWTRTAKHNTNIYSEKMLMSNNGENKNDGKNKNNI
tara:strand:+ start:4105 stop:4437 length:333 start_codon:yes stop_codon:yes gene_type:complete